MSGVPTRLLHLILEAAPHHGLSVESLTRGLDTPQRGRTRLLDRVDWDLFATVCDRVGEQLGSPDRVTRFGEQLAPGKGLSIIRLAGRAIYDPRDLIMIGGKWLGPMAFPMLQAEITERPDGLFVQRLILEPDHRYSASFFHMLQGVLMASPVQWGSPPFEVEMDLDPSGATMYIRPQATKLGLLARLRRQLVSRSAFRSLIVEVEGQRTDIQASYREVRRARDRISIQARELEQVNSIGRELSQCIEIDHVAEVLTRVLLEDLAYEGAKLEFARPDTMDKTSSEDSSTSHEAWVSAQTAREVGRTEGPALRVYSLETAAGSVGSLSVWRLESDRDSGLAANSLEGAAPDSVLERLIPWISIAIDNARAYRTLKSHADELQSRVLDRTARLLATNHQLVREIEERKQANQALSQSEAQLRASERMASIGTLAAGIAHEINNPIGSILAAAQFAQLVSEEDDATGQIEVSLSDIVTEAKRCGEIVRSVLQFSRDERTEKWDCQLQDIVHRACRLTAPYLAEFNAKIRPTLPPEPIWIHVNPIQIEQALVNLIRNAIEANSRDVHVVVNVADEGQTTLIEVRDDGKGISGDDHMRVFEPFYTTKRADGGTGLGLSVVHGIVKEHQGMLKAAPNQRGGASVLIELPMIPAPPKSLDEKDESAA